MNRIAGKIIIIAVIIVLLVPLAMLICWSFANQWNYPDLVPDPGIQAWKEALSGKMLTALFTSIPLSAAVVGLSLILSFFPAKILGQCSFKGRKFIQFLLFIPSLMPTIAIVFGMQTVLRKIYLYSTWTGVLVAELCFFTPYLTLLLSTVFKNLDPLYEQQAKTLGVNNIKTIFHVVIPAIRPGLFASLLFVFIGSWSNYLIVSVIGPATLQTFPVLIFPMLNSGNNSFALAAVYTIVYIAVPVLAMVFLSGMLSRNTMNDTLKVSAN